MQAVRPPPHMHGQLITAPPSAFSEDRGGKIHVIEQHMLFRLLLLLLTFPLSLCLKALHHENIPLVLNDGCSDTALLPLMSI